eukprot:COSAG03_NODE_2658_length_2552_cov_75.142682_2_plen_122_part_00
MDDDNSGYITRAELRRGLIELGVPDTQDSDMDELMMAIDADGDGRVGVSEFLKAFKSLGVEKNLERERKKASLCLCLCLCLCLSLSLARSLTVLCPSRQEDGARRQHDGPESSLRCSRSST